MFPADGSRSGRSSELSPGRQSIEPFTLKALDDDTLTHACETQSFLSQAMIWESPFFWLQSISNPPPAVPLQAARLGDASSERIAEIDHPVAVVRGSERSTIVNRSSAPAPVVTHAILERDQIADALGAAGSPAGTRCA